MLDIPTTMHILSATRGLQLDHHVYPCIDIHWFVLDYPYSLAKNKVTHQPENGKHQKKNMWMISLTKLTIIPVTSHWGHWKSSRYYPGRWSPTTTSQTLRGHNSSLPHVIGTRMWLKNLRMTRLVGFPMRQNMGRSPAYLLQRIVENYLKNISPLGI